MSDVEIAGTFGSASSTESASVEKLHSRLVVSIRVDCVSYAEAVQRIIQWGIKGHSRYVCVANVHSAMEAHDCREFRDAVNSADLVTPDGVPLVWALRSLSLRSAQRVYGPDLTLHLLTEAEKQTIAVGFYGASPQVLARLQKFVSEQFPKLRIAYAVSPPFRKLSAVENEIVVEEINRSGARILFVGLGCPKQEIWMAQNRGKLTSAMVGVGAAFDFLSGGKRQAPRWMMQAGFEWLFRLFTEPRRLWRRYFKNNPRFILLFGYQRLRQALSRSA